MENTPQVASDVVPSTIVGNLDLSKRSDRQMLRRSLTDGVRAHKPRWGGLDDGLKNEAVRILKGLMPAIEERGDVREVRQVMDMLIQMEGQNQADEHLIDKNARLDAGFVTERVEQTEYKVVFDNVENGG